METYEDYLTDDILKSQMIADFATALNYYMKCDGVKQRDLINDLNLSSATISTWVNGKRMPKPEAIKMLSRYFHVSEEDMRRLPARVTSEEHDKADITDKLNELVYLLSHTRDIRVNGHTIPDYMAMNLFAPLSATLQYAENIKSE
nr:MAG TPA: Repressor protein CI [Caudoviricetes sp.]